MNAKIAFNRSGMLYSGVKEKEYNGNPTYTISFTDPLTGDYMFFGCNKQIADYAQQKAEKGIKSFDISCTVSSYNKKDKPDQFGGWSCKVFNIN